MTGVQIVGIAVISLVVIFLVAEYFMANFMATYILTPPSKLCPTPEQIRHRISQTGRVTLKIVYKKKRKLIFGNIGLRFGETMIICIRISQIFAGVIKYLGWESYFNTEISGMMPFFYVFDIPECTVSELGEELKEKIGMNGVRIVGNPEDKMKRVAIVAHLYPNSAMVDEIKEDGYYHSYDMEIMKYMETENIDAIIPGEIIEWTILSYIRDAAYMGKHKACFNIGHFNMEELGMKYAADWIGELLNNEIPVNYIPTEDGWTFL